jgi:hypothetical protein
LELITIFQFEINKKWERLTYKRVEAIQELYVN